VEATTITTYKAAPDIDVLTSSFPILDRLDGRRQPPLPIAGRSIQHERGARSLRLSFTDTDGEASQFVVDVNRPVFGSPSQLGWRRCSGASAASVRG
jgi:hypothetical protein